MPINKFFSSRHTPQVWKFIVSISLLITFQLLSIFVDVKNVNALVSACNTSISPSSVTNNSNNTFTITIQNTDSVDYSWIKITRPNSYFEIQSNPGTGGWSTSTNTESSTLLSGSLTPGSSVYVTLYVDVRNGVEGSYDWTVQASDDSEGANPFTCTGSLSTAIASGGSDTFPPVISSVSVSNVLDTTATITWTTDEVSDSTVYYDTNLDYSNNLSTTSSSLVTSHSLDLSSLTPNVTYYFYVESTDSSGNSVASGDFSFTAAKASTTVTVVNTETKTETKTVTKTVLIEDTEKPVITFATKFTQTFSSVPAVSGKVTDNAGVALIEYSSDGGENWLPVDETTGIQSKTVNFSFTLLGLLDGNYRIKVRATDLSANIQVSDEKILIYDRLPPEVGGVLYSLGPQILLPENGDLKIIAGVEFKITLSAIGGPTEITVRGTRDKGLGYSKNDTPNTYSLKPNPDTGLWNGTISFADSGRYTLTALSIDGAGNETSADIGSVNVLPRGVVIGEDPEGEITIYYLEETENKFVLWDGLAYAQENPIKVDSHGNYSLILPAGKYFLQVASGQRLATSKIFTLDQATSINSNFNLADLKRFKLGPISFTLPAIFQPELDMFINKSESANLESIWNEKEFPDFELNDGENLYDEFYFRGKPTVYSFLNTWLPQTAEQLSVLEKVSDVGVNSVIVIPQESLSRVSIFKSIGKYNKLIVADPDGILLQKLDVNNLPVHFFVDRRGVVRRKSDGIINEKDIAEILLSN